MSDRITKANLQARVENLNRRMEQRGSKYRYEVGYRNGYAAIDRVSPSGNTVWSTVRVGGKSEMSEFLYAMTVALDDAATTNEAPGPWERGDYGA